MENFSKEKGDFRDLYLSDEIVDTFKKADQGVEVDYRFGASVDEMTTGDKPLAEYYFKGFSYSAKA